MTKRFLAVLLLTLTSMAQMVDRDKAIKVDWTALSATGSTAAFDVSQAIPRSHTVQLVITGGPAACTGTLQGSQDGTNWADLSSAVTCTSTVMFHATNKPVLNVRFNLSALSGGTSPTVTVKYSGTR